MCVEGVVVVVGAIDFMCCISTIGPAPFGRPWCLCTFCDLPPLAVVSKCSHSYSSQMKFCTHLQIALFSLRYILVGGGPFMGESICLMYMCLGEQCSVPDAIPTCTAVVSSCMVLLLTWILWGVPWIPYNFCRSSGGVLTGNLYLQWLRMQFEVDPEKPQPCTLWLYISLLLL